MSRAFLVDDHPTVCYGLSQILKSLGFTDVVEAGSIVKARELILEYDCGPDDVVLLDLTLKDGDGVKVLQYLRKQGYVTPVLIHSITKIKANNLRLLKEGANGFLSKGSPLSALPDAINCIRNGGIYLEPDVTADVVHNVVTGQNGDLHNMLSARELEVLLLLGQGLTITTIANNLGLSVNTVSTYRARIVSKFKVDTILDLMRYTILNKLV